MKKQKQNRAITLIALIITIVVLLILAGVSINFTFGNEGIFSKTQYAVEKYKNAQEDEEILIAKYTNDIENHVDGNRGTVTLTQEEYNELKSNSKKINIIETTTPSSSGWNKLCDYPTGFNKDNFLIYSFEILGNYGTNTKLYSFNKDTQFLLDDDEIKFYNTDANMLGKTIKIYYIEFNK